MTSSPKLLVSMTLDLRCWDVACLGGILAPDIERESPALTSGSLVVGLCGNASKRCPISAPLVYFSVQKHMTALQQIIVNVWILSTTVSTSVIHRAVLSQGLAARPKSRPCRWSSFSSGGCLKPSQIWRCQKPKHSRFHKLFGLDSSELLEGTDTSDYVEFLSKEDPNNS